MRAVSNGLTFNHKGFGRLGSNLRLPDERLNREAGRRVVFSAFFRTSFISLYIN